MAGATGSGGEAWLRDLTAQGSSSETQQWQSGAEAKKGVVVAKMDATAPRIFAHVMSAVPLESNLT